MISPVHCAVSTLVGAREHSGVEAEGDEVVPEAVKANEDQEEVRAQEKAVPDVLFRYHTRTPPDAGGNCGGS